MSLGSELKNGNYGNAVDIVTTATGIKKVVKTISDITGTDCGCDKRKEKMNQWGKKNVNVETNPPA